MRDKSAERVRVGAAFPVNVPAAEWETARDDVITKSQKSRSGYRVDKAHILGPLNDDDLRKKVARRDPHAMCDRRNPTRVAMSSELWEFVPIFGGALCVILFLVSGVPAEVFNTADSKGSAVVGNTAVMEFALAGLFVCVLVPLLRWVYLRRGEDVMSRKESSRVRKSVTVVDAGTGRFSTDTSRLANVAIGIAENIGISYAYQSSAFDLDRVRVNIPEELRQIISSCELLNHMEERLDKVKIKGWQDMSIKDVVLDRQEKYDLARDSVTARVTALNVYLLRLREVEALISSLNRECHAVDELLYDDSDFDKAFVSLTGNHAAVSHTLDRADDIKALKGRIQAQLDFIRTNILGINGLIALENAR